MNVMKYLAPPREVVCIGPHTSVCMSCNGCVDLCVATWLNDTRCCLPLIQPKQCVGVLVGVSVCDCEVDCDCDCECVEARTG